MKTIDPKQTFLKTPDAARFADAMNQPLIRQGIEIALQQFVMNQMPTTDLTAAAVSSIALEGAKRYVSILLNLTEPDQLPTPDQSGKLQWPSKVQPSHNQPLVRAKVKPEAQLPQR